jgi:hypothetical protein
MEERAEGGEGGGILLSPCFRCRQAVFEVLQQLFPLLVVMTALTLVPVFGAHLNDAIKVLQIRGGSKYLSMSSRTSAMLSSSFSISLLSSFT